MTPSLSPQEYRGLASKPKQSKYGAVRTVVDGVSFDSKREADRWSELQLLEKAGEITALNRQVRFALMGQSGALKTSRGAGHSYVADFTYFDKAEGRLTIEDVKGFITPVAKLKLAIMEAMGLKVKVVR